MPSPRRDHRSRSGSRSPEPPSKGKRSLDLVSTRRYSPPNHFRGRGRGRGMRRPFVRYNEHGTTIFRGTSQRYYPRHNRREDTKNRRSHSRSPERSRSHDRHRKSRSSSSSSHHHERSKSHDKRRPSIKDRSRSPEHKKKKADRRSDDASESHQSRRTRSSSHEQEASHSRSKVKTDYAKYPETTEYEAKSSKYVEAPAYDDAKYSDRKRREEEEEDERRGKGKRYREASRSPEEGKRSKKMATSVPASTAGRSKEIIPRNRLHKIFSLISQDVDFELDEDISIAIQRNPYAEPSEDSTVTVVFDEALFNMIYPYEGRKHRPIFDREEIKMFGHDKNLADDPDFEREPFSYLFSAESHCPSPSRLGLFKIQDEEEAERSEIFLNLRNRSTQTESHDFPLRLWREGDATGIVRSWGEEFVEGYLSYEEYGRPSCIEADYDRQTSLENYKEYEDYCGQDYDDDYSPCDDYGEGAYKENKSYCKYENTAYTAENDFWDHGSSDNGDRYTKGIEKRTAQADGASQRKKCEDWNEGERTSEMQNTEDEYETCSGKTSMEDLEDIGFNNKEEKVKEHSSLQKDNQFGNEEKGKSDEDSLRKHKTFQAGDQEKVETVTEKSDSTNRKCSVTFEVCEGSIELDDERFKKTQGDRSLLEDAKDKMEEEIGCAGIYSDERRQATT